MGMKSKSGHFPSGNGAGGASKRTGSEKGVSPKVGSDVKRMSQKGQELYNKAEDPGLKNQIKELYRPGAVVGDGGTADALREENKTGKKVGGKSHTIKARERLRALQKISLKRGLSESDKSIANDLINDLEDALKGSKKMMTQKELNKQLLSMIPNLQKKFDETCNELDGIETGSTIVVEDVFMPFFIDAVVFDKKDLLVQAQSFIEWLSDYYDDEYAGEVLVISIYESIHYSSKCEKLINSLGPKAKKQYDSLEW